MLALIAVSIFLAFFVRKTKFAFKYRWLSGVGILSLFFFIGYLASENEYKKSIFPYTENQELFIVNILEKPQIKPNSIMCKVMVEGYKTDTRFVKISSKALIYLSKDSLSLNLKKGDVLSVRTKYQSPAGALNPEGFDYARFLLRKGITATAFVRQNEWRLISSNKNLSIVTLAENWRDKLLSIYQKLNLPNDQFAVLAALTLGYKDALEPDIAENYSYSGAMHILAVSGLHVGVVFWIFQTIFSFVFKKISIKFISTAFTVCALWLYAFITGLPPSVIRATTMFSLVSIGTSIGRKAQIFNTISVSAFVILLLNPNVLYDVGFQLSYAAVIGIVYFQPKISSLLYVKNKLLKWWWDLTAVSLAAQITTLPLSLFYFNQFPNYFLLSNYIAIPLATFIIYVAVLYLVISPFGWLTYLPALVLKSLLFLLNYLVAFIHDLPKSVSYWYVDVFQVIMLLLILTFFAVYQDIKKYWAFVMILVSINIFVGSVLYQNIESSKVNRILVFADNKNSHINIVSKRDNIMFSTDSIAAMKNFRKYWGINRFAKPKFNRLNESELHIINNKMMLFLTDSLLINKSTDNPLKVDVLIIGNGIRYNPKRVFECVNPKLCVADNSLSTHYIDKLRKFCVENDVSFYSVAEHGAYIHDFE
ncbi:ComEC/Rec2 family competence protein [Paludibacter sp.]